MPGRLEGQVAIITGAGSGYGFGIATKLKSEGANIVVADLSEANGSKAAKELNGLFVQANVAKREEWQNLLDGTIKQYGRLDIVVNNAGGESTRLNSQTLAWLTMINSVLRQKANTYSLGARI